MWKQHNWVVFRNLKFKIEIQNFDNGREENFPPFQYNYTYAYTNIHQHLHMLTNFRSVCQSMNYHTTSQPASRFTSPCIYFILFQVFLWYWVISSAFRELYDHVLLLLVLFQRLMVAKKDKGGDSEVNGQKL